MALFKSLERKSLAEKMVYCGASVLFALVAASYLYILVWMFIAACKSHSEIILDPFGLPAHWNIRNFADCFAIFEVNGQGFWIMLFNSLWWSVIPLVIQMFTQVTFAYACSKYKFPTSTWPYYIIMVMMTLPIYGSGGASYRLSWNLGLINNYFAAFVAVSGFSTQFLYFQAYFRNLSWTYVEAAQIDGANDFQAYFKVMLPQTMPLLSALSITAFIGLWNSYEGVLIQQPNTPTLPVGIYQFNAEMTYRARLDILFAAAFLISIPCIVLFIGFNKIITTNVSFGGIKG